MITGETKLAGVLANPIKHSLSPFIHNQAFELTDENGAYLAFEINETELQASIEMIRTWQMYGVNLSMPFKKKSLSYVDEISPTVRLTGAMNTIVNQQGRLIGHNTDGIGFIQALSAQGFYFKQKKIIILGAGGAAMAIVTELLLRKEASCTIAIRRTPNESVIKEQLAAISNYCQQRVELIFIDEEKFIDTLKIADLIVNATSVGMKKDESLVPKACLNKKQVVVDIIYQPQATKLIKDAQSIGCQAHNGIGMLLYQAAESYFLWTGKQMPTELIEKELVKLIEEKNK